MAARFVDVSESQIEQFKENAVPQMTKDVLFPRIITSAILLKQLVTSGSLNITIVTSTSYR